ncbi:MAG: prolipoprotein diacylglyceryl transferase [Chloroflexota bacterium]|nr:prolipoprotein diacylglyceryl transferase [Chloroflexota bacterium]
MDLPFDPTMTLGPIRIAWHSFWSLVAMGAGSAVSFRLARSLVKDERIYPFAIAVVIGGLVAARIGHIADNWSYYGAHPDQLVAFWNGGVAVTSAPIGSAVGGWLAAKRLRLPLGFMFDITVIGITLGEAIGRIGDIINGEHHAIACSGLPWCVRYTDPATLGQRDFVHPVAAYDLVVDLLSLAVLLWYWPRVRGRQPEGRVFWLYLVLYGGFRFATSFLRLDPVVFAGLQEAQLLGLIYLLAGVPALIWLQRRERRPTTTM